MLKLARRVPQQDVEAFVLRPPNFHPAYFVLREYGYEFLHGWHRVHGATEVSMNDDVFYKACCEYLKEHGLIFESIQAAARYAEEHGLLEARD